MRRLPLTLCITLAIGLAGCGSSVSTEPAPQSDSPAVLQASPPAETLDSGTSEPTDTGTASVTRVDKPKMEAVLRDAEGKVRVVNIWATWCLPCVAEMPHLVAFYNNMDPESTAFLSISADGPRFIDDSVVPFVTEHSLPFPVYALEFDDPDPLILAGMLGVQETGWDGALPATFVIGRDGTLVKHWFEEIKPEDLKAAVVEALGST